MIFGYFKRAFEVSLKEWMYFLLLSISIYFNWNVYLLKTSTYLKGYKIIAYVFAFLGGFISTLLFFSFAGRVTRHTYGLESLPYYLNIKQSVKATTLFLIFATLMAFLSKIFFKIITSPVLRYLFFLFSIALIISFILETIKVFFLEKEVFSFYDIFTRTLSLKYWISLLSVSFIMAVINKLQEYLFTNVLSFATTSQFIAHIITLLKSFIYGYFLILILVFFIIMFDLKNDTKFENIEISI